MGWYKLHRLKIITYNQFIMALPGSWRERVEMWRRLGYFPRIRSPRTFNERIAWRKHYQFDERLEKLADKWEVREYVSRKIGPQYLAEAYGIYDDEESVDFEALPQRFVMKPTHCSGHVMFVEEKEQLDRGATLGMIRKWLQTSYGAHKGEYWYTRMPKRVIAEEWLSDESQGIPIDYKFHVFHGKVEAVQIDFDRQTEHRRNLFDRDWQELPVRYRYPTKPEVCLARPKPFPEMLDIAELLGREFDYVRVDLYCLENKRIVFGELTFAPESGRGFFVPRDFDYHLGRIWGEEIS